MRLIPVALLTLGGVLLADVAGASTPTTTCAATTSCFLVQNTSSGPALHAQAASGYGVRATSVSGGGMLGTTSSGTFLDAGVEGESTNQSGRDAAGAFGLNGLSSTSTAPEFGVYAIGSHSGVLGETVLAGTKIQNFGVFGFDATLGTGDSNAGVLGKSYEGTGVIAESNAAPTIPGEFAGEPIGLYAVATPQTGAAAIGALIESGGVPLVAQNTSESTEVDIGLQNLVLEGLYEGGDVFTVDTSGNTKIAGTLTTQATNFATKGADGSTMTAYGERSAAPEIEDVGAGQLVNGRAYVRLDGALHNVIDQSDVYHVFVTPDGDCNGLYVADRSPTGFTIRELRGGRSTLAFEYRIVAKPRDSNGRRLAIVPGGHIARRAVPAPIGHDSTAESPAERLRASLGPVRYAKLLNEFMQREAAR